MERAPGAPMGFGLQPVEMEEPTGTSHIEQPTAIFSAHQFQNELPLMQDVPIGQVDDPIVGTAYAMPSAALQQ